MANTLAIVAAFVLAIAGLFAFKTNTALEERAEEVSNSQAKHQGLMASLKSLGDEITTLEGETTTTNERAAGAEAEEQTAQQSLQTLQAELAKTQQEVDSQRNSVETAQAKLDQAGDVRELAPKVAGLTTSIAELEDQIATAESRFSALRQEVTASSERAEALKTRQTEQSSGKTDEDLRASLISVYSDAGFVIVSGGDAAGIAANSKLDVVRGDQVVATLLVTAVEPNRAAASILPDTVAEGIVLRGGDVVVASAAPAN